MSELTVSRMLHFFGADQDVFLNLTSIRRPAHRDNLPSVLGYETDSSYPHAPYIRNAKVWYLDELDDITFVRILEMFLVWMVLYNYIIPLSMYVSLELQKFLASQQFQWDLQLYDRTRQTCRRCWTMFRVKGQVLHSLAPHIVKHRLHVWGQGPARRGAHQRHQRGAGAGDPPVQRQDRHHHQVTSIQLA